MRDEFGKTTNEAINSVNRVLEEKQTIRNAKAKELDYIDINNFKINPDLCDIVSEREARDAFILPFFKTGKKLRVAVLNPTNEKTNKVIEKLRSQKYLLNICLASKSGLLESMRIYASRPQDLSEDFDTDIDELNIDVYEKEIDSLMSDFENKIENISSAELLNMILVGAIKTKASDIHLEPKKEGLTVRFRIDGMLRSVFEIPEDKKSDLLTQAKHKANMKLNVNKRPQDGRFFFIINKKEIDVRVSALPTPVGEDMVLRILDKNDEKFSIDNLGLKDISSDLLREAIKRPYGMILTTGPTGSGKTTTLYSLLHELNTIENKIITIEDPIEYKVDGITQSQISEENDYVFANGLKSILRQDPDIIMVGEIRDLDTAQTAAQAALTGHKVLSTLHTNDAIGAVDRLINMGLEVFMVAPALDTIIAQRLARASCIYCAKDVSLTEEQEDLFKTILERLNTVLKEPLTLPKTIKKTVGCDKCSNTGYSGRIGLYEVVQITDEIRKMILDRASAHEISHVAKKKSFSIFEAGIMEVIKGTTSIEEILRISKAT